MSQSNTPLRVQRRILRRVSLRRGSVGAWRRNGTVWSATWMGYWRELLKGGPENARVSIRSNPKSNQQSIAGELTKESGSRELAWTATLAMSPSPMSNTLHPHSRLGLNRQTTRPTHHGAPGSPRPRSLTESRCPVPP